MEPIPDHGADPALPPRIDGAGDDLPPGARLGKFRIERKLGEGGMGAVYVARDTLTDARVALKVLLPERRDVHRLDRFKRESLICQQIRQSEQSPRQP